MCVRRITEECNRIYHSQVGRERGREGGSGVCAENYSRMYPDLSSTGRNFGREGGEEWRNERGRGGRRAGWKDICLMVLSPCINKYIYSSSHFPFPPSLPPSLPP